MPLQQDKVSTFYKGLLESDEGDVTVKLKDGSRKIISYIVKKGSPVFKTMLESEMQEAQTRIVDLSKYYTLEAFEEFMAYLYYNKQYGGKYVPLLFEILHICDYYGVNDYKEFLENRIISIIDSEAICLTIAAEALKFEDLTNKIYAKCLEFLLKNTTSQTKSVRECYDQQYNNSIYWCCLHSSNKNHGYNLIANTYRIDGRVGCMYMTLRKNDGYSVDLVSCYNTERCCEHDTAPRALRTDFSQLPAFIIRDLESCTID